MQSWHPIDGLQFLFWLIPSQSKTLLLAWEKQQNMTRGSRPLSSMWDMGMNLLSLGPGSALAVLAILGVN